MKILDYKEIFFLFYVAMSISLKVIRVLKISTVAYFELEILKRIRNNYYLATEIEKEQNICPFFDRVTFLEEGIFRIFRAP